MKVIALVAAILIGWTVAGLIVGMLIGLLGDLDDD